MEKISFAVTIQVASGPSLPIAGSIEVEAYEKLNITVPPRVGAADGTASVAVAPGELSAVHLLVIQASTTDGKLSFQTSAAGAEAIPLRGPITLIGSSAVSLLRPAKPDRLTFTNAGASEAQVAILVGRKAVG